MVGWYNVRQLAVTGVKVLISSAFGAFSDKREMMAALHRGQTPVEADFRDRDEMWIDYVADVGDGFDSTYSVARLLARKSLKVGEYETARGDLLIMGGDQVYPTASRKAYEYRFKGPYKQAFPRSSLAIETPGETREDVQPALFAIPGNHDWSDGLTNFLKVFCHQRNIGAWKTYQNRSYFAVPLPQDVWIFGIDIQLDADIDHNQMEFFKSILEDMKENSKVIVCTAEPSWIYTTRTGNTSYKNLEYFERVLASNPEKKLTHLATIAGDLHHYARYEAQDGSGRQRITAGGGGAFLHPTHNLPATLDRLKDAEYEQKCLFPDGNKTKRIALGNLLFGFKNLWFAIFFGCFFAGMGWLFTLETLKSDGANFFSGISLGEYCLDIWGSVLHNPGLLLLNLVLVGGLVVFADSAPINTRYHKNVYRSFALLHGLVQLLMFYVCFYFLREMNAALFPKSLANNSIISCTILETSLLGGVIGSTAMGLYLYTSNVVLGMHDNEAFSSLRYQGYKNFLRFHLTAEELTIYPMGIPRVSKWDVRRRRSKMKISGNDAEAILIEGPIKISLKDQP